MLVVIPILPLILLLRKLRRLAPFNKSVQRLIPLIIITSTKPIIKIRVDPAGSFLNTIRLFSPMQPGLITTRVLAAANSFQ